MSAQSPPSIGQSKHDRYIVAHAVLGSLATLVVIPAAILVARYLRTWRHWNVVHLSLQTLAMALIVITFALGNAALRDPNQYFGPHSDLHHKLGLAAFLIFMVQYLFGIAARYTKPPSFNDVTFNRGRSVLRYWHIFLGIAATAVLYAQVYTGFGEWDESSDSMTLTPRGIRIAYWILLGVAVGAYLLGWAIMEPIARSRKARQADEGKTLLSRPYMSTVG